jgi:hypothetical protein
MLTAPLTVLNIWYPPVVYITATLTVLDIMGPSVDYVNSPSHRFKHNVFINSLC